jgi:hypothetical protein
MMELYLDSPKGLHGVVLNYLSTGKTLPLYLTITVVNPAENLTKLLYAVNRNRKFL